MSTKKRYFNTFDALRFLSFFLVFLHHLPIDHTSVLGTFTRSGSIGVSFFFVLSGFLITYLLIYEKDNKGHISLGHFFIRRILRIWPLFYAMILFAFATPYILQWIGLSFTSEGYTPNWLMSMLFLENYKIMLSGSPNVSPLWVMWSLCVEEHFYIIWGVLLFLLPVKRLPQLIGISIVIAIISRAIYSLVALDTLDILTNIDYFAYGAIPAFLLTHRQPWIERAGKLPMKYKYSLLVFTTIFIFVAPHLNIWLLQQLSPIIIGLLFACIILFTITEQNTIYISNSNILSRLGLYTYGLYLYHTIVINLMIQIFKRLHLDINSLPILLLFSIVALLLSIALAAASYHLFEKQFLKLKNKFY